jgi:hypothetical protein
MRLVPTLAIVIALGAAGAAQQVPDLLQMAGRPLPAPELQAGVVSVRVVREQMGNNVPNHPVTLKAGSRSLTATTDAQGRAAFGDVPPGTQVIVETVVDGETLRSQEFAVPASGGVRVALIAGLEAAAAQERAAREQAAQRPAVQGTVVFGGESRVILEFQDDNLQVFYLLDIVNTAPTPIDIGEPMVVVLPEGVSGAGALDGSSPLATVQGDRVRIGGPFPPGSTGVQVGYRFAYSGDTATLTQQWPAAFEQLFVAAEKVGNLQMSSPQFQQQQEASSGGAPFLMATGGRIDPGGTLTITLTGLPHRSTLVRDIGLGVGLLILVVGFWAALGGDGRRKDQSQALTRRREKLFAEMVALEEQRRQGRVDDARYTSRRQSLMSQLERVMGEIDRSTLPSAPRPRRGGPDDEGLAA